MDSSSTLGSFNLPTLCNEPLVSYAAGSEERSKLIAAVDEMKKALPFTVHPNVDGQDVTGEADQIQENPFNHKDALAKYSHASPELVEKAIKGALEAKKTWCKTSLHDRASIFYRAAALIRGPYRYQMMAATMIGQGKNAYQADIDCAAESIDFLTMYPSLAETLYKNQPPFNATGVWNRSEVRPLDGFVYAIAPFNFTALAVNLVVAPLIVGNVVVWKPSPGAIYSSWLFNHIMLEAGLPPGVVQFLPGDAELVTSKVFESRDLGALHFTGSTAVFRSLSAKIGSKMNFWRSYPRIVGETGGKNFHLIHPSADIKNAALKSLRAAFEYQGQKCSALSRVYIPKSRAEDFKKVLVKETEALSQGEKFTDFAGPVISRSAFDRVARYVKEAHDDPKVTVLAGGKCDNSVGYYIRPTVIETTDAHSRFMIQEIFGPFMCLYVYDDEKFGPELFELIDNTTEYALTGAIFSRDRRAVSDAVDGLRFSAGNFYINDQCTGAMPGHQPFGGSRGSGTNDKAGTAGLLTRFVSSRTIKENYATIDSALYPSNLD
ncbi:delta-1-pyrroline-5-carboxylate dehydrogenase 1 [Sarocladium strictum]